MLLAKNQKKLASGQTVVKMDSSGGKDTTASDTSGLSAPGERAKVCAQAMLLPLFPLSLEKLLQQSANFTSAPPACGKMKSSSPVPHRRTERQGIGKEDNIICTGTLASVNLLN